MNNVYYIGIDNHKKYSQISIIDAAGKRALETSINHENPGLFKRMFERLDGPAHVVFEAGLNWSWLYEQLEQIQQVQSITLANPYKVRLIAEAQIKTDKLDARKLAQLLRLDVIPSCHVPDKETRNRKDVLRQRSFWVKERTKIRSRIHEIIDRQHNLAMPQVSDMFGKKGRAALEKAVLPEPDQMLLRQNLSIMDQLNQVIREAQHSVQADGCHDAQTQILESIPGIGSVLANIIATETDGIERFLDQNRYSAYTGLIPSTYSSGGKTSHGQMLQQCNKWLKWAYIEAAWVAIGCSPYFGYLYRYHRNRGKKPNTAITIVARRMCRIAYQLLTQNRIYEERLSPAALVRV